MSGFEEKTAAEEDGGHVGGAVLIDMCALVEEVEDDVSVGSPIAAVVAEVAVGDEVADELVARVVEQEPFSSLTTDSTKLDGEEAIAHLPFEHGVA